jgi:hypothetical protein
VHEAISLRMGAERVSRLFVEAGGAIAAVDEIERVGSVKARR